MIRIRGDPRIRPRLHSQHGARRAVRILIAASYLVLAYMGGEYFNDIQFWMLNASRGKAFAYIKVAVIHLEGSACEGISKVRCIDNGELG